MRDFVLSGQVAAQAIIDWMEGATLPERMYVDSNIYVFDWRQLKRWGIDEDSLPEGSGIEYREISIWEQYGAHVAAGLLVMALQMLLIITLLVNRSRRKKEERELIEANKMKDEFLINTSHECKRR